MTLPRTLFVDESHLGRFVTGLERITLELFSREALAPLPVEPVRATGTASMIAAQTAVLPTKLARYPRSLALCPGFPPSVPLSLFGARVVPYIHDTFLLTRPQDLNWRAKTYMAPAFAFALKRLPWLLANSETTRSELARLTSAKTEITLYRPHVRDIFGVADQAGRPRRREAGAPLRLIAIGTVEPRKNLPAAAAIVAALRAAGMDAHLDVIGRIGWGEAIERLKQDPNVTLHGYMEAADARARIAAAHAFISTSHDEGLGLTLLEAQHAGLAVIAAKLPVFAEVLGDSGLFIDPSDPTAAAARIAAAFAEPDAPSAAAAAVTRNLARWNGAADRDREALVVRLGRKLSAL